MSHKKHLQNSLMSLGYFDSLDSSGLESGNKEEFASGYSLENSDQGYNPTGIDSTLTVGKRDPKAVLNIDMWNSHVKIRDIAEGLHYTRSHDCDQFWQQHSTKTGLKRVLTAADRISNLREEIDSGLATQQLNEVEDFAYSLIEYELSGVIEEEYEDWPEKRASYDDWPAAETLDFIRDLPEDSVEYEAYKRVRDHHLEDMDPIPDSEFPDIEEIMPSP